MESNGPKSKEHLHVAPIEDAMLLGLGFMTRHKATVDLDKGLFHIQGQSIPFIGLSRDSGNAVSAVRIRIPHRAVVPARSVIRIPCVPEDPLMGASYDTEPDVKDVLACRVFA